MVTCFLSLPIAVFYVAKFDNLNLFVIAYLDSGKALHAHLVNECKIFQLQTAIFHEAILNCVPLLHGAANMCT